jgi:nickel-type superoxide dismutase maturation protease
VGRYEVSGDSMLPALSPGDWLLVDRGAYRSAPPRAGDLVIADDPRTTSRALVKRVASIDDEGVWLEGDNPGASTDSRHFGPIALTGLRGRVVFRYWPSPALVR